MMDFDTIGNVISLVIIFAAIVTIFNVMVPTRLVRKSRKVALIYTAGLVVLFFLVNLAVALTW